MTEYEKLLVEAEEEGVEVLELDLGTRKKCGRYLSNNKENIIIINSNVSSTEKCEVLAEELGHYYKSFGNILDQSNISNVKQEKCARNWVYEKSVGIVSLINAFEKCINNRHDLAEYLNITEKFLEEVIKHYKEKYGTHYKIDNYIIYFEPNLRIVKMF